MRSQRPIAALIGLGTTAACCALLVSCSTAEVAATSPCVIALPEQTLVNRELLVTVRGELQALGAASVNASTGVELKSRFQQTYQKLGDRDVACGMLLRTLSCLATSGRSSSDLADFRSYLKDTQSCEPADEARVAVDKVIQTFVDDAFRFESLPIALDLFVRNSGDRPASVNTVRAIFDEHLAPSRAPSDMQRLTAVYAVTVDGRNSVVRGAEASMNSPANAWYPNPGSPKLLVETPVAQSLGARSTDRFRVTYTFLDSMENRGPREKVRLEVNFSNGTTVKTEPLNLVRQQPCLRFQVNTANGPQFKEICK